MVRIGGPPNDRGSSDASATDSTDGLSRIIRSASPSRASRTDGIRGRETRLAALLDQLTQYVKDAKCPACGSDLITKERLLAAIASRKADVPEEQRTIVELHERLKQDVDALQQTSRFQTNELIGEGDAG